MNDPLGLFESSSNDPLGLFDESKKKPQGPIEGVTNIIKTGLGSVPFIGGSLAGLFGEGETANKEALAEAINAGDVFLSSQAASLAKPFSENLSDNTFRLLQERLNKRKQWANPNDEQTPTLAKLGGMAATAPLQIPRMFGYDAATTGKSLLDAGESLPTAVGGTAIDTAGNMVGAALPMAKPLRNLGPISQVISGSAINVAQDYLTKQAISGMASTEQAKKQFTPTAESALLAATGGAMFQAPSLLAHPIPTKGVSGDTTNLSGAKEKKALERIIRQAKNKVEEGDVLYTDKTGIANKEPISKVVSDAATIELAKKQQAEALANEVKQKDFPEGEQIPLFGDELLPHDTNQAGQLTRQPEQTALDFSFNSVPAQPKTKQDVWYTGSPEVLTKTRTLEEQATRPNAEGQKAGPGHYITMSRDLAGLYGGKEGSVYTVDKPFSNAFDFNKVDPNTRVSNETMYNNLVEQTGSRSEANKTLQGMGYDAITFTDGRGNKIANIFSERPVSLEGPARKVETFLGELELLPKEERPVPPDTPQTPRSPENIALKQQEQTKLGVLSKTVGTKDIPKEWLDVTTLEEAKHLASTEPDLRGGVSRATRQAAAGIQGVTIMSGNPLLRYIRKVSGDGRALMARLSQELVTNKQDGLAIKVQNLSGKELTSVIEALRQGSQNKFKLTPEVMDSLGFNEKQRSFVESYYKHSQALLDNQNAVRQSLGFKPIEPHEGWFTDVWKGQFKTAVFDKKGDVVAFITTDTKYGQKAAKEYYAKQYPDATFGSMLYSGLNGKNQVDVFSGLNDVLAIIAKNDPKMAEVLSRGQEVQKLANNDLFGVSKHELRKSGKVGGSEGNKPWLSREKNAKEAARAMIDYFETAIEHMALQKPLAEINKIVLDPEINQPNAKAYLQQYADHIKGNTGSVGKALNSIFDTISITGVGSRVPVNFLGHVKSAMNRKFMGLNLGFLSAQLLQPAQTWAPVASILASKIGLPQHDIVTAFARGSQWALVENLAKWYDKPELGIAPEHIKEAIKYANDRGLFAFNELELSHRATKKAITRKVGSALDFTISAGDRATKLPAFLGLVDMLYEGGSVPLKEALSIAEKSLETGMTNYHPWERPLMYQKLGVLGQFAGGLTTFKHSQANLYSKTIQEAFGRAKDPRSMLLMTGSMLFFAGITGMMGYGEADQLYGKITEMVYGKPHTIREDFLKGMPEFLKSGVVSAASDLNFQAKVSAADMVPDTVAKAVSPHLEAAGKVIGSVAKAVNDPSKVNIKGAVQELMPTGLSKLSERLMNTDERGRILGKDGLPKYETPSDPVEAAKVTKAREVGSYLGMGTLYDAIKGADLYKDRQAYKVQQDKQKAMASKIKSAIAGKEYARAFVLAKEYDGISNVPGSGMAIVEENIKKASVERNLSPKQRAQGTPKDLRSVRKYQEFNDGE